MSDDAKTIGDFRPEARTPHGFQDRRARDLAAERAILEAVSAVYERYGFEHLDTPAFEFADALGKFLPDSDRPNEGVFALQDSDEQWMALRYDLTAPLARFAAQNWETLPKPFRRYAHGTVWRNEKPGPGRFREFIQCDADTVGSDRPEADAEIVAMAVEGLRAAGLPSGGAVMKINSRKLLNGLLAQAKIDDPVQRLAVLRAADKLDRLGEKGVRDLLGKGRLDESGAFTPGAAIAAPAVDSVMAFLKASGGGDRAAVLDALQPVVGGSAEGAEGLEDLARIDAALKGLGVSQADARFDPAVVRGLEYYTGAVYEAELIAPNDARVSLGSVGGGGRYDDLVARFTGTRVPATGFSFGVSRLATALSQFDWLGSAADAVRGPVVVTVFDQTLMGEYFAVAAELRAAGVAAEVYLGSSGLKAQMKYADRRLSPAVVIIGGDEAASGAATVKDLDLGRQLASGVTDNAAWREGRPGQMTVPRSGLVEAVKRIVDAPAA